MGHIKILMELFSVKRELKLLAVDKIYQKDDLYLSFLLSLKAETAADISGRILGFRFKRNILDPLFPYGYFVIHAFDDISHIFLVDDL